MKPCVLFVDDQPRVLEGLRRSLRLVRDEWEMLFAYSSAEALNQINLTPIDVIVSDMRMPGMNGMELLSEVAKRQPRIIRMILSGQTDEEAAMRLVSNNHQFLSKPCDSRTLVKVVNRALSLRDLLSDESLQSAVSALRDLPSPPAVYDDLVQELHSSEPSTQKVADIISVDVGLTVKVLQVASSGYFSVGRSISNPLEAVTLLGIEKTSALVLSHGIAEQQPVPQIGGYSLERLWKHSVACGSLAQAIVLAEGLDQKAADSAFVAGLLHDIGSLVIASNRPDDYEAIIQASTYENAALLEAERELLGATHGEIGAYLVGLWGLSDSISETIAYHHTPSDYQSSDFGVLTAVHVAEAMTQGFQWSRLNETLAAVIDVEYLREVGVAKRLPNWIEILRNMDGEKDQP